MFEAITPAECCLCGATENLTGEHKIKASALRKIFGSATMVIGHFDGTSELRIAQGPKSSQLHFKVRICEECNSARTQPSDREFDQFHQHVVANLDCKSDADPLYPVERYPNGSKKALNVFRYFAKLLCCQIADANGPRLPLVAAFSLGSLDFNPIKLMINRDPTYQDYTQMTGDLSGFAAHGGLVVNHDRSGQLTGFHSTLTLGPVQYVYWVEFRGSVQGELEAAAPAFFAFTQSAFRKALKAPMSDGERRKLGFGPNEPLPNAN